MNIVRKAFYKSVPVMAGYLILGIGFGILMDNAGYGVLWSFAMSLFIYAGSMQYVGIGLLTGPASMITTAITTIMVNARHLFYSISMIDRYKGTGKYKPYLIFGLTDETYSLLSVDDKVPGEDITAAQVDYEPDKNVVPASASSAADLNRYRFFVTLFNQSYWVTGCTLGGLIGSHLPFSTEGIEFSMTALFIASFTEQWLKTKEHIPAIVGFFATLACLAVFGTEKFLIPAMILITLILTALRARLDPPLPGMHNGSGAFTHGAGSSSPEDEHGKEAEK